MKTYDFIAIGDTVTDEFIMLKDARVICDKDGENCELAVRFGDKVPFESVETVHAVGNSANAAVSATRLGLQTALVTNIGDDELGQKILATLSAHDVSTAFVRINENMESNHHYVLSFDSDRTILIKHQAYPYALPDIGEPTFLYLSSLASTSLAFHHEIGDYLKAHPQVKLAFQPGTFQIKLGKDELKDLYERSYIFFCNKEEAERILGTGTKGIKGLAKEMSELGPEIVCITDGPKGAYAYDREKDELWHVPMYPDPKEPVDRTGAGDAFASTVTAALAQGVPLHEALAWGPINSMSVVQYVGAQKGLLTRQKLDEYLTTAPDTYKVEKVG
jgi:ribokinase